MAKGRNGSIPEEVEEEEKEKVRGEDNLSKRDRYRKSKRKKEESSSEESSTDSEDDRPSRSKKRKGKRRSSRRSSESSSGSDSGSDSEPEEPVDESDSEASGSDEGSEDEVRKKKRKERKRRRREREKEEERERRRRKEKRRRREKEERRRKKDKDKKKKKKKEKDGGRKGAVTNSWGKYGIIRETDMWTKRPEFTAWLSEVKQVNLETLPNWEEKQMFKQFMEDHNTATFPSKKYYDLDAYHRHKLEKEIKKGLKKASNSERTIFNDEEQRRLELMRERERQKEEQVEALKRSMQGGMAQAMKEQARLKEEMAYQYRLGNFEAAAAIQRRLDPDVAM